MSVEVTKPAHFRKQYMFVVLLFVIVHWDGGRAGQVVEVNFIGTGRTQMNADQRWSLSLSLVWL